MAHRVTYARDLREQLVLFEGMVGALERALHYEESEPLDCVSDANRSLNRLLKSSKKSLAEDAKAAEAIEPYLLDYEQHLGEVERDVEFERWSGAQARRVLQKVREGLKLITAARQLNAQAHAQAFH